MSAYKAATEDALRKAVVVEKETAEVIALKFDYQLISDVMRLIKELNINIQSQDLGGPCFMELSLPLKQKNKMLDRLDFMNAVGKRVTWKINSQQD